MKYLILISVCLFCFYGCNQTKKNIPVSSEIVTISADFETTPVKADTNSDAADDPAFWFNKSDSWKSIIFGSDKKNGIAAYNLNGNLIQFYPVGRINNIDVIQNVIMNNSEYDLLGGSNRSDKSLIFFTIDEKGSLSQLNGQPLLTGLDDVYGFTFYQNYENNKIYAFISDKEGNVQQWELFISGNNISGKIVRQLKGTSKNSFLSINHPAQRYYTNF